MVLALRPSSSRGGVYGAHIAVALFLISAIAVVSRWLSVVGNPMFFDPK
jgi:hypothetical protein